MCDAHFRHERAVDGVGICIAAGGKGFPCCCLVVVEEGEFERGEGARGGGYGWLEVA